MKVKSSPHPQREHASQCGGTSPYVGTPDHTNAIRDNGWIVEIQDFMVKLKNSEKVRIQKVTTWTTTAVC